MHKTAVVNGEPWFFYEGECGDVVLSTRVRLARNLANFLFPAVAKKNERDRVQSLVFDSFSQVGDAEDFHAVRTESIDALGTKILSERGVLDADVASGLVMRGDSRVSCRVNSVDHVRISAFEPGLACDKALADCRSLDETLQKKLQFAASYEFGYLTAALQDAGSGMKISIRAHLPALSFAGEAEDALNQVRSKGLDVSAVFGAGGNFGRSLGAYYEIATSSALNGSEFDQMASVLSAGKYLVDAERKFRSRLAESKSTALHNIVLRAFATARFSVFLTLREAVEIVSSVKWGRDMDMLRGIGDAALCALLYRIQDGHVEFLIKNGKFSFENDIKNDAPAKIERLRALIVQEAFANVRFVER